MTPQEFKLTKSQYLSHQIMCSCSYIENYKASLIVKEIEVRQG